VTTRVGIGYDSHRFAAGRPLRIAGVTVPHTDGLAGHSDGDVALHAVVDALLGAMAMGDIGRHFRDDDPRWRDADSTRFVGEVAGMLRQRGVAVGQVDVTIIAERPKLAPLIEQMRAATARALGVEADAVSIKAKTNEGMGWIGRGEGIAALAVATVRGTGDG
jgi:2-C-methyl-D-erythritol 2,4-cyclodiphosphate synthase